MVREPPCSVYVLHRFPKVGSMKCFFFGLKLESILEIILLKSESFGAEI